MTLVEQVALWVGIGAAVVTVLAAIAGALIKYMINPVLRWRSHQREQKQTVREFMNDLEDRDVLYSPFSEEHPAKCINSVYGMRNKLGETRNKLDEDYGRVERRWSLHVIFESC